MWPPPPRFPASPNEPMTTERAQLVEAAIKAQAELRENAKIFWTKICEEWGSESEGEKDQKQELTGTFEDDKQPSTSKNAKKKEIEGQTGTTDDDDRGSTSHSLHHLKKKRRMEY